jgi:hypothetical protein
MSIQCRINILRMCIYFIASVCTYDIYCTVKYSETLGSHELNPIALMLISEEKYTHTYYSQNRTTNVISYVYTDVSKLILFKVLGLVASLEIFDWLINSKYTKSTTFIILVISLTQLSLLIFLLI